MSYAANTDRERMLQYIGMLSFAIVDLNLYLDTHPNCKNGLEYFNYYNRIRNKAMEEFSAKYGPLIVSQADNSCQSEWKWSTQPFPWEGGC